MKKTIALLLLTCGAAGAADINNGKEYEVDQTISADLTVRDNLTVSGSITGSLTGAASLNVLKAGDTMTGALAGTSAAMTGQVSASNYVIRGSTVLRTSGLDTTDRSIYAGLIAANNTAGLYNSVFGMYAGNAMATGSNNTLVGYAAGLLMNGVDNATIVGSGAGAANTAGNGTFFGYQAANRNASGASNTAMGLQAAYGNSTGSQNTAVGFQAGYGVYDNSNSSNTYMGYRAGYATTTGGSNTCIGSGACLALTTGSNNIVIGNGADTLAVGTNNSLNIGGLITGDLNTKIVNISSTTISASSVTLLGTAYVVNSNVGIGDTTPTRNLDVAGTTGIAVSSATTAGSAMVFRGVETAANIKAADPVAAGEVWFCSDCTGAVMCVSTGTAVNQYSDAGDRAAACE